MSSVLEHHPIQVFTKIAQQIVEECNYAQVNAARINQAIANETQRLGLTSPIINRANNLETPAGTLTIARHQGSRKPYNRVAVSQLQKHLEYFFDINILGFPFNELCFINEPKIPVFIIEGDHPEFNTI